MRPRKASGRAAALGIVAALAALLASAWPGAPAAASPRPEVRAEVA